MLKYVFEVLLVIAIGVGLYHAKDRFFQASPAKEDPVISKASLDHQHLPHSTQISNGIEASSLEKGPKPSSLNLPEVVGFSKEDAEAMQAVFARFATGDFVGALELADRYRKDPTRGKAFHRWIDEQMPALLASAGWARLKLGDCDQALAYFKRGEKLTPTRETIKGLAVCHYKQKNMQAALDQFSKYFVMDPNDQTMRILYSDVLESEGRYHEAVQVLEELEQNSSETLEADRKVIRQRLSSMRARARESDRQLVEYSRHFRLAYRAYDHEDLVSYVLTTLEQALDEYVGRYGFREPQTSVEVILYQAGDFKSMVVGGPDWAEGLFDGRMRIPVHPKMLENRRYNRLWTVLRHELVHALFARMSDSRSIPPWFEEGMAQRLSCATPGCKPFEFPPKPGVFLPAQAFFSPYTSYSAIKAGQAYGQSLYLIYALEQVHGSDVLRRLISPITTSSRITSDAILKPVGTNFRDLHKRARESWANREILRPRTY